MRVDALALPAGELFDEEAQGPLTPPVDVQPGAPVGPVRGCLPLDPPIIASVEYRDDESRSSWRGRSGPRLPRPPSPAPRRLRPTASSSEASSRRVRVCRRADQRLDPTEQLFHGLTAVSPGEPHMPAHGHGSLADAAATPDLGIHATSCRSRIILATLTITGRRADGGHREQETRHFLSPHTRHHLGKVLADHRGRPRACSNTTKPRTDDRCGACSYGSPDWIRTSNPSINSRMLCR